MKGHERYRDYIKGSQAKNIGNHWLKSSMLFIKTVYIVLLTSVALQACICNNLFTVYYSIGEMVTNIWQKSDNDTLDLSLCHF